MRGTLCQLESSNVFERFLYSISQRDLSQHTFEDFSFYRVLDFNFTLRLIDNVVGNDIIVYFMTRTAKV